MDLEDELRLLSMLAGACLLLFPAALQAQTVWDMPTEYPQNAMPGVGLTAFAKHIAESSAGKLEIRPSFDAKAGIKSADMLAAPAMPSPARLRPKTRSLRCPRYHFW